MHQIDANLNGHDNDIIPIILGSPETINGQKPSRLQTFLLDSGSGNTWINRKSLPLGTKVSKVPKAKGQTLVGMLESNEAVFLKNTCLPEFSGTKRIQRIIARVFDTPCRYDVVLGHDIISQQKLIIDFDDQVVRWTKNGPERKMWPKTEVYNQPSKIALRNTLIDDLRLVNDVANDDDLYATEIKDADYHQVDIADVIAKCTHLTSEQCSQLEQLLNKFTTLFNGKLGKYPHAKIHLDVDPNAKPVHRRHYPIPRVHYTTFKHELDRLVKLDVLTKTGRSAWAAPTMIIPKKDQTVRWVSDFRALNKVIKRKQYPLPKIAEIIARRTGYKYFTKLDISMQYYTFELDDESSELCTIATPFGLYRYNRLPMGVNQSPDVAQEVMEKVLDGIEDVEKYIDDVGCFSDDWESHLKLLEQVLSRLEANGFTIKPQKCEWGVQETDWLGHWLTPIGIKPWKKKIDAVLRMEPPKRHPSVAFIPWLGSMVPRHVAKTVTHFGPAINIDRSLMLCVVTKASTSFREDESTHGIGCAVALS